MKILHVYKDYCPPIYGGMERYLSLMCRYQKQWCDVEVLVCGRRIQTRIVEHDGIRVTEVGELGRFQSAPVSPLFPVYLRKLASAADVTVIHMPNPTAEIAWLLTHPKSLLVVRYQSDVVRQATAMRFYGPLQASFLRKAKKILPSSEPYLNTSTVLQKVADKCHVLPLGIDVEAFNMPEQEKIESVRHRYGGHFVLFAGLHRYYKGLTYLVSAASQIQAHVVIAGEGPETTRLKEQAKTQGDHITFTGRLTHEDLVTHLHACAVFVFPSIARSEAFGMSILEAHVCGKPVVATRLGTGVEWVNLDGVTGLNVPPCDANALAEATNTLLQDDTLRTSMGQAAQERVMRDFTADVIAYKEYEILKSLVND